MLPPIRADAFLIFNSESFGISADCDFYRKHSLKEQYAKFSYSICERLPGGSELSLES